MFLPACLLCCLPALPTLSQTPPGLPDRETLVVVGEGMAVLNDDRSGDTMNGDLIILLPIALVLVVIIVLLKTLQRRRVRARVQALYRAARDDDTSQIQHNLDQGVSIDLKDDQGNTGSHENLRNREGLTAPEMASLADCR